MRIGVINARDGVDEAVVSITRNCLEAHSKGDYQLSDRLRKELSDLGWEITFLPPERYDDDIKLYYKGIKK